MVCVLPEVPSNSLVSGKAAGAVHPSIESRARGTFWVCWVSIMVFNVQWAVSYLRFSDPT